MSCERPKPPLAIWALQYRKTSASQPDQPQTFQRQHGLAHLSSPHHPPSPAPPDLARNRGDREREKAPDTESLDPKTGAPSSPTATPATATTRAEPCQGGAVRVQTTEAPCAQGRTSRGPRQTPWIHCLGALQGLTHSKTAQTKAEKGSSTRDPHTQKEPSLEPL